MNYHKKANITLTAVFIFFLGAALLEHLSPNNFGIRLIYFVSEAALVGGIADWFAVTAIFKKPLGWGYHTALIPRNREKVIEAVATIVQTKLLHMDVIRQKIERIPLIDGLFRYVEREGGSKYLTNLVLTYIRRYADKQEPSQLAERLAEYLRKTAKTWYLAPKVQIISGWALTNGYIDEGLDLLAEKLWDKAAEEETRLIILRYLEEVKEEKVSNGGSILRTLMGFMEMSDGLNLDEAADALQVELLLTIRRFRNPLDPLRVSLRDAVIEGIAKLDSNIKFVVQAERWKQDLLTEELFEEFLETVLRSILNMAAPPLASTEPNVFYRTVHTFVEKYWVSLQANAAFREQINLFLVDTLCQVIQNEHNMIGCMVRETLTAYTDQNLNQFIEEKAGNDLQWIRINGSMIGGVIGLILFLFLDFVYTPYIWPVLINFIR